MISVSKAQQLILDAVQPLTDTETLPLGALRGRVLAADVISALDFPHWDNSAMDGYGVRYGDVQDCDPHRPVTLEVVGKVAAGQSEVPAIASGQAVRIFTGAMVPPGVDTVIMQEDTVAQGDRVVIRATVKPGQWVRHRGHFLQRGAVLLAQGTALGAAEIAILGAAQQEQATVVRSPRVGLLSTGNELVAPGDPLKPGQIVDSNMLALTHFAEENHCQVQSFGAVGDDRLQLTQAMAQAITSQDFVLSTGGVSVGEFDYVPEILRELGGELLIESVAIKPGKPLKVAKFPNGCLYFGIPGNPVSALVSCWRLIQPAITKLRGIPNAQNPLITVTAGQELRSGGMRETYLWGQLLVEQGQYHFYPSGGSHSSGNLINLAGTNALGVIPVGVKSVAPGEKIQALVLSR